MTEHYLELVLDGALSQADVEKAVRARADADRLTKGPAYDSGGWNNLSVMFHHRRLLGVANVTQARQVLEQFDTGDGIAVRVVNDGALLPMPAAVLPPAVASTLVQPKPVAVEPAAEAAAETTAPEPIADAPAAAPDPVGPRYEDSEDARPLLAKREQLEARMQAFAEEIVQRLGTQTSKTRWYTPCGSSIAVTHIKASPGEGGFTTIRCPVCNVDNFCVFPSDLERRDSLARQHAKVESQIAEGRAAFEAVAIPDEFDALIAPSVEADEAVETVDAVEAADVTPEPVPAAVAEAESLPHAGEPNTFEEDEAPSTPPEYVWLVAGYVRVAAQAA